MEAETQHVIDRDKNHTCHALGCFIHVPPKLFMCKPHWFKLPFGLRCAVWAAYTPGQEKLDGSAFPTEEYLEVTREAINVVAVKEGRINAV